jgi:hypothetical protein
MKKIVLFSGILMLQSLFFVGSGAVCNVENVVFKPGERLEYQLFYNVSFVWIQAGTCQFNVNEAYCRWQNL